jgi:mycoredoxin
MRSEVVVYGKRECADTLRTRALLRDAGVEYRFVDVEASADDAARATALGGSTKVPVVVLPDGAVLVEPSDDEVRAHL